MRKGLVIVLLGAIVVAADGACLGTGDSDGTGAGGHGAGGDAAGGGAGGGGATTASATASTGTTESTTSTTGGAVDCSGYLDSTEPCSICAEQKCCAELQTCKNDPGCWDCNFELSSDCSPYTKQVGAIQTCKQEKCEDCKPPEVSFDCGAPVEPAESGACVEVGLENACDPVTNEGCDAANGEACDVMEDGYACYPSGNTEPLCAACGVDGKYCVGGLICINGGGGGKCARYCCDDKHCGAGAVCAKEVFNLPAGVGVCVVLDGSAGGGGSGGGGGSAIGSGGAGGEGGA